MKEVVFHELVWLLRVAVWVSKISTKRMCSSIHLPPYMCVCMIYEIKILYEVAQLVDALRLLSVAFCFFRQNLCLYNRNDKQDCSFPEDWLVKG